MVTRRPRASLRSDPDFLLEYIDELPDESGSDEEFDGYLGPDDGPIATHSGLNYDRYSPSLHRSRSLDSLTEAERETGCPSSPTESPLPAMSPSPSPMQGQHASGSPLSMGSPTHSQPSTNSSSNFSPEVTHSYNIFINTINMKYLLQPLVFTASPGVVPDMTDKSPLDFVSTLMSV